MAGKSSTLQDLERQVQTEPEQTSPVVFQETDGPFFLNWIARGTDGNLYIAPAIPGGWLQRKRYEGSVDNLIPVSAQKARTIRWYLYGDVSDASAVRIAGN